VLLLLQGVSSAVAADVDGGPARAVAAAQQQQRLFESMPFIMAPSSTDMPVRVDALAGLIKLGGGQLLQLQPGQAKAVTPSGQISLSEFEFRSRRNAADKGPGLVVLCGEPWQLHQRRQLVEVCRHWGVRDVVTGMYVLDCITAFQVLPLDKYRQPIAGL
jgi:hypothetical protein